MLQTPSSILSFSSLSKALVGLLGGFCIGAQITASIVLPGLVQVPNLKKLLHASPTLEIVLIPTKCVPSSGDVSLPYVAVVAYATIVFTGLFCILRAKGFSSRSGSQPSDIPRPFRASNLRAQPPSPPPEPVLSWSIRASAAGIRLLIHTVRDEPWDALIDFGSLFADEIARIGAAFPFPELEKLGLIVVPTTVFYGYFYLVFRLLAEYERSSVGGGGVVDFLFASMPRSRIG
ncbi:hypothetical protein B0H15DRAFT_947235 [Mycena belliarum]|uniref:Uncharacterized protein n=1 Tax=Mycena belliarum TaxID=1033014 RepID=A0AAD6U7H9_9AGAR|nr:hypothetical protein B0H15DRAFT_947235 [Mycena belliae]